jgi:hypothetical protein
MSEERWDDYFRYDGLLIDANKRRTALEKARTKWVIFGMALFAILCVIGWITMTNGMMDAIILEHLYLSGTSIMYLGLIEAWGIIVFASLVILPISMKIRKIDAAISWRTFIIKWCLTHKHRVARESILE